jgi:hypothetical protein
VYSNFHSYTPSFKPSSNHKLDDQFKTKTVKINFILEMEDGTKLKVMNIDLEKAVHRELTIKGDKVPVSLFAIFVKVE